MQIKIKKHLGNQGYGTGSDLREKSGSESREKTTRH